MQPKPVFPRQLGPEAQQPTSRPLFRPAFKPRLGRFRPVRRRLPGAVDRLLSASDGHPRSSREQSHLRLVPPVTLTRSPFSPHLSRAQRRRRAVLPMVGDRGRRWPATVEGGAARHMAAACSSLPPFFLTSPPLP
jgi:hypothetical protein